jgi:phosphoglycolate phosphatase-like HAD superfamily hydrolase
MSTQIFGDNPDKKQDLLVLFDHDGTTCLTNENAYESIQYGIREAAKMLNIDISPIENNWDQFFHETRGTTEQYVLKVVFNKSTTNIHLFDDYANLYYTARANWYKNMKSYRHYTYDTYYPDAESLIFHCWKTPNIHLGLLTGNPIDTMRERLATHLSEIFFSPNSINTFGNEASSREELIRLSIEKAKARIPNFDLHLENNIATNVVYIGDSRADLFSGLTAQVKTVWIPSRMLQITKDSLSEDAIILLRKLLPKAIHITNSLETPETLDFVVNQ